MKKYLILFFVIYLSGCCTKKLCSNIDDINEIELLNFSASDVDSIIIKTYQKNSGTLVDSIFTSATGRTFGDSDLIIFMPKKLNTALDYRITILSINKIYLLTDFKTRNESCNTCFPVGHDKVTLLDSYLVNGQKQTKTLLEITK